MTAANAFLETTYLPEHNRRFAVAPHPRRTFIARAPSRTTLDRVFQLEEARVLSNDWVVRYDSRYLQVARQSRARAGAQHGDGARSTGRGP